jgi:uncharacterized protein YegL
MRKWMAGAWLAVGLSGCGSMASTPAESNGTASAAADASNSTDGMAYTGKANAGDAGGGAAVPVNTGTASDQAIGLKPGGAQDIAFFRMKLASKQVPKAADMTIEGWLNEHDTVLPAALKDRSVTLHALAGIVQQKAGGTSDAVLQLGLNSGKTLADVTEKVSLTVVIDRSGSMQGNKISDVRAGLHELVQRLPQDTLVSLVSFSSGVTTDVQPLVASDAQKGTLDKAIDALKADGGTNLYGGLAKGIEHCKNASKDYPFRHVLLLSDGVPTEGNTDKGQIEALASAAAAAGCTVSSVGVGFDFDLPLMTHIAQKGNGTAWFVQDSAHAKEVFVQDLETMLLPVATNLTLSIKLAAGWKVAEIYGFDWIEKNGEVQVTGAKKDPQPNKPGEPPPVTGETIAMPTLYASKRNGMVMVRLLAPEGADLSLAQDLQIADVTYGYTLAKAKTPEQFTVPVQIPGLVDVPDEGLQYFTGPIVRRSWLLLHTGLDLIGACKLAEAGQPEQAAALLDLAVARIDAQVVQASAPVWLTVDASAPDTNDARQLLLAVKALLAKP